jgi:DNA polymerase III sliding clamp (beta) subunit (PCNA family)
VDIRANVKEEGELGGATVPAKLFGEWIGNMDKSADVTLKATGKKDKLGESFTDRVLALGCHPYRSNLKGLDPGDMPAIVTPDDFLGNTIVYETELPLSRIVQVEQLTYATVDEPSQPAYTGVLFEFKDDCMHMTALDGYRMGHAKFSTPGAGRQQVLLPTSAANLLAQLASEAWKQANPKKGSDPQEVTCKFYLLRYDGSEIQRVLIHFPTLETSLFAMSITAEYPDYRVLLNTDYQAEITLDRKEALGAVNRVSRFALSSMTVSIQDGAMGIKAASAEEGDCYDEVAGFWDGDPVSFQIMPRLFRDALTQCRGDRIKVRFDGRKIIVQPVGDESLVHLAMSRGQEERQANHHANYAAV